MRLRNKKIGEMMIKKIFILTMVAVLTLATGCSSRNTYQKNVSELLQVPADARIYLANNFWYKEPGKITSLNIQEGKLLRFGTEVTDIKYNSTNIIFKRKKDGKVFNLKYEENYEMDSITEYIKKVFISQNPVEIELKIKPEVFEKIRRGVVEPGMTKDEVIIAFGAPGRFRTANLLSNTWIYIGENESTIRVVFRHGKVLKVLDY